MRRLAAIALLALCAAAPFRSDGAMARSPFKRAPFAVPGSAPAFLFTAPAAGDVASLTAITGQTWSCSRAFTDTVRTSATAITSVASGHCAVADLGVQMQEARTNLLLQSQTLDNAAWHKDGSIPPANPVVTANTTVAPDGTTTAETLALNVLAGANQYNVADQGVTVVNTSTYAVSVYELQITAPGTAYLIPQAGNVPFTTSASWTRVSGAHAASGTSFSTEIGFDNRAAVGNTGNGSTFSLALWGTQLELGAFATSYIPTVGTTVTRAAEQDDVGAITLGTSVSLTATVTLEGLPSATATALSPSDGVNAWVLAVDSTGHAKCTYAGNSDTSTATVTVGTAAKIACTYDGATVKACVGGACHGTAAVFTPATAFTHLYLGWNGTSAWLNGWMSSACAAKTATGCAP